MTSSTSTLRRSAAIAIAIACCAGANAAAQCHSTGIVMVKFKQPSVKVEQFPIRIRTSAGDRDITVTRDASGKVWREDVEPFHIASSQLVHADVPGVRTGCNIAPEKDFKVGRKCVAMYVVDCDPVWSMNVNSTREGEAFGYRLDSKIAACEVAPPDFQTAATPRSILDIGAEDKVIVKVRRRESFISVLVTQKVLRTFQGTARFSQLDPLPTTETPVTAYTRYLKQAQADKNRDLTFSMAAGGGE
jgi:hypothetical protein